MVTTTKKALIASPFIASWAATARPELDRFTKDRSRREAAWAQWALESAVIMSGTRDRDYPALVLDGRFHDPKGSAPLVRPHLEIPPRIVAEADPEFPIRLALAGNALGFPWWLYHEATALRRAIFGGVGTSISSFADLLYEKRSELAAHVTALMRLVAPHWTEVEAQIFEAEDGLAGLAASSFTTSETEKILPEAHELALRVDFDPRLSDKSGVWASRRVGVWNVSGLASDDRRFALGVLTPRLTANSQFADELFAVGTESPASLLVRALLLRRIASECLGLDPDNCGVVLPKKEPTLVGAHLKAVAAVVGKKLPEASEKAAVGFLTAFPDSTDAWRVLSEFSSEANILLTVTQDGFEAAFRRARRFMRRAEALDRDDINVMLPIGWDSQSRVVRIMFSRNPK